MTDERRLLRHVLASLAYRTQKALRDAPAEFATFRAAPGVRTPAQLVHHMSGVLAFALGHFTRPDRTIAPCDTFDEEIQRFHGILESIARHLDAGTPFGGTSPARLLQGPLADALTHAGQLAMLRRLSGSPIPPEDFHAAAVSAEHLGPAQPNPLSPDTDWRDAEGRGQESDDRRRS